MLAAKLFLQEYGLNKDRDALRILDMHEIVIFVLNSLYWTRVRSLAMLVTHWLTHSLTQSLPFNKLDWCDPGVWRCQLNTCWGCYWWCWETYWLKTVWCRFGSWSLVIKLNFVRTLSTRFGQDLKLKFRWDFEAEFWSVFCCWCLFEVTKLKLGQDSEARFG